jgi:hypothetical protein
VAALRKRLAGSRPLLGTEALLRFQPHALLNSVTRERFWARGARLSHRHAADPGNALKGRRASEIKAFKERYSAFLELPEVAAFLLKITAED